MIQKKKLAKRETDPLPFLFLFIFCEHLFKIYKGKTDGRRISYMVRPLSFLVSGLQKIGT